MHEVDTARLMAELLQKTSQAESTQRAMFRPVDGIWHIAFNDTNVHVPDLKGFWHLRQLMAWPHQHVKALSLVGSASDGPIPSADTGPMLDREALMKYRERPDWAADPDGPAHQRRRRAST